MTRGDCVCTEAVAHSNQAALVSNIDLTCHMSLTAAAANELISFQVRGRSTQYEIYEDTNHRATAVDA